MTRTYMRRELTGMTPSSLRRVALAGMVAILVGGAACAETPDATQDDSIEALQTRANAGDAYAQNNIGVMYANGQGVPQDDVEAAVWYRQAAEQGHAMAQNNIGVLYTSGQGVPQDDVEAVAWYRQAAEQGHAAAQYNLGVTYYNGDRVPQDDVEAYLWANLAATYADAEDRDRYAEFRDDAAERLTPEQRTDAQRRAREFFEAHPPE